MALKHVSLKVGNMRKAEDFVVYPGPEGAPRLKLQSDHRVVLLEVATGRAILSRYAKQYPGFHLLAPQAGAVLVDVPAEKVAEAVAAQAQPGQQIGPGCYVGEVRG